LAGTHWLNRTSIEIAEGRTAAFFHGAPDPGVIEYHGDRPLAPRPTPRQPSPFADRVGFLTDRSMIFPGKKIDVVQIWSKARATRSPTKARPTCPRSRSTSTTAAAPTPSKRSSTLDPRARRHDRLRRRNSWWSAGSPTRSPSSPPTTTPSPWSSTPPPTCPIRRTFQWRNPQFKDFDEDAEEYDDYHTIQGLPTAMTITRYHNGDMISQRFLTKVVYDAPVEPSFFDPATVVAKLAKKK
jgi:hypothetical protein